MTQPSASLTNVKAALERAEPVTLPTETVYGLAARADSAAAIAKIYALKQRPADKPLPICLIDAAQASALCHLSAKAKRLIAEHWPGPLTIIAQARAGISLAAPAIAPDGSLALRLPSAPWVDALARSGWDVPLVLTSANKSGGPNPRSADDVRGAFGADTPVMIDSGPSAGLVPSTIIDTRDAPMRVVREGALPPEALSAYALDWSAS